MTEQNYLPSQLPINKIVLGLGSNVGNRELHIENAVELLTQKNIIRDVIKSQIFISKALLKEGSPKEWDLEFFNIAVCGFTHYKPKELLKQVKKIEKEIGRSDNSVWAPREIDIDILAYNEEIYEDRILTIPHRELLFRNFALIPFSQVWPDWRYPIKGQFYSKTAKNLTDRLFNK